MAALIIKDRALGVFERRLVTDVGGAPCCCGGGSTGPCCSPMRLPFECSGDVASWPGGTRPQENPATCCTYGTRFRRRFVVDIGYSLTRLRLNQLQRAGRFNVRIQASVELVARCIAENNPLGYFVVESTEASSASITGEAMDDTVGAVTFAYSSSNPPPGVARIEDYFAPPVGSTIPPGGVGTWDAMAYQAGLVSAVVQMLIEAALIAQPDMLWVQPDAAPLDFLQPNAPGSIAGPRRGLSLLAMNHHACVEIGYIGGLRCDCPRSYRYVYEDGSPAYFNFRKAGDLPGPTITWDGAQACGLATYSASNGGTLQDVAEAGGPLVVSGEVLASSAVSIATNVIDPCSVDPCPPGGPPPVPLTPSEIERQIAVVLNGLL